MLKSYFYDVVYSIINYTAQSLLNVDHQVYKLLIQSM